MLGKRYDKAMTGCSERRHLHAAPHASFAKK